MKTWTKFSWIFNYLSYLFLLQGRGTTALLWTCGELAASWQRCGPGSPYYRSATPPPHPPGAQWFGSSMVSSVVDPWYFGTDPDANPDSRIRTSVERIRMAQKRTEPTDPDPEHWQKVKRSHKTVDIKVFLTIFAWWWKDQEPEPY